MTKTFIVRIVNDNIEKIFDGSTTTVLDITKNIHLPGLIRYDTPVTVYCTRYEMREVDSHGLPITVDHEKICHFFKYTMNSTKPFKYWLSNDESFSCIEICNDSYNIFMPFTYKNQIVKSSLTKSMGILNDDRRLINV